MLEEIGDTRLGGGSSCALKPLQVISGAGFELGGGGNRSNKETTALLLLQQGLQLTEGRVRSRLHLCLGKPRDSEGKN